MAKSFAMVSIILLVMFSSLIFAWDIPIISFERPDDDMIAIFNEWLVKHNKVYNALGEKQKRFEIFKDNLNFINEHNAKNESYQVGLNQFADMTLEEFKSRYLNSEIANKLPMYEGVYAEPRLDTEVPSSVDWREKGAVTPIKNQGECGSCWIFSAVATVESLNQITTGRLISLSEQQILDCNKKGMGCSGELPAYAYEYIIDNGGVTTQEDYPYRAARGTCDKTKTNHTAATIDGYGRLRRSEAALVKALAVQPISVSLAASSRGIQFYEKGVYTGECGFKVDHSVTAVGYGKESMLEYWIIKDSWGEEWGEKGYMRLQRNTPFLPYGKCDIALDANFPIKRGYTLLQTKPYQTS